MRCLVTGAAGFIGSTLCDELLNQGHEVVGVDAFSPYYSRVAKEDNLVEARTHALFRFVEGDLMSIELASLLEETDVVYHLAAQPGVRRSWGSDFDVYVHHNILSTQRLLEACRSHPPQRLVFSSSSSIYGDATASPVKEDALPRPVSPYGMTKLAGEQLCHAYAEAFAIPVVVLRYFTVFGPRQRPDMAFHRFIRSALTGAPIFVYGDGGQRRDFTYVSDAVAASIAASVAGPTGATYNVGGGSVWTVRAILSVIERLAGGTLTVSNGPASLGDVRHTSADTTRARNRLHYDAKVGVEEGLTRQVEWMRWTLAREQERRDGSLAGTTGA